MNKLVVTTLESKFFIYDMRTQHPTQGFASLTEKASDYQESFVVPVLQYAIFSGAQIAYCLVSVSPTSKQRHLHDSRWKWDFAPLEIVCARVNGKTIRTPSHHFPFCVYVWWEMGVFKALSQALAHVDVVCNVQFLSRQTCKEG